LFFSGVRSGGGCFDVSGGLDDGGVGGSFRFVCDFRRGAFIRVLGVFVTRSLGGSRGLRRRRRGTHRRFRCGGGGGFIGYSGCGVSDRLLLARFRVSQRLLRSLHLRRVVQ
jgi:hypothetical protein